MRIHLTSVVTLGILLGLATPGLPQPSLDWTPEPVEKPRVVVLTDITNEPDDQQSLVRFLVYANEFDVEGIVATTSRWLQDQVRPDRIVDLIRAYGQVRENLLVHAAGYPTEEYLLSVVRAHLPLYGMKGVGAGRSSPGSQLIIDVVDRDDERPVWVTAWGGANCLAQALWDVRETRRPEDLARFVSKLRVYTISDQDDSGRWLRIEFPDLFYIVSPSSTEWQEYHKATWTGISGDRHYRNGPMHRFELVDNPWLEEHIINKGPLGALYPKSEYIMEGDTPSFLGLIDNGLGSALSPAYGGWGGRYHLFQTYAETRPIWGNTSESRDTVLADDGRTYVSDQATIWRWREAFQHDFAARMDWTMATRYEDANHNPIVVVDGHEGRHVLRMTVPPGMAVTLSAADSRDPDGDALSFNWFVYSEAGTWRRPLELIGHRTETVRFTAPQVERPEEIHIICELRDDGAPSLYSYRRIIISIRPGSP